MSPHPPNPPPLTPAALRRLFRRHATPLVPPPSQLEARLLAEHRRRYPTSAPTRLREHLRAHRIAAVAASLALIIGACQLPIAYHRDFGVGLECAVNRQRLDPESVLGLTDRVRSRIPAKSLSLQLLDEGDPTIRLRLDAWGTFTAPDAALDALRAELPALADAPCQHQPLAGTVHGTLAGRLGYGLLDLELDRKDAAAARAQILQQLRDRGFSGHAEVDVRDLPGEGKRELQIRLSRPTPAAP